MKIIVSAVAFSLLLIFGVYAFWRLPVLKARSQCYGKLMQVYNQRGTVTRHSYMSDEQICLVNKSLILDGLLCFQEIQNSNLLSERENQFLDTIARFMARATKTPLEIVLDHNNACNYKRTRVLYDLSSDVPFAANFE